MSAKGASRVGVDKASGIITGPGARRVFVEGKNWSIDDDSVAPHGDSPHSSAKMIASTPRVVVENAKPVIEDDRATCNHAASGSSRVFVGS